MLPILTRYLNASQYGVVSNFIAISSFLTILIGLNSNGLLSVKYVSLDSNEFKMFFPNFIYIAAFNLCLFSLVVTGISFFKTSFLGLDIKWIYAAGLVAFFQFIYTLVNLLYLSEENPLKYGIFEVINTVINMSLSVIFIVLFDMNESGRIIAVIISTLVLCVISLYVIWKRELIKLIYVKRNIIELLSFGVPLLPHALSNWVRIGLDRFIVTYYLGIAASGIYFAGFQIASVLIIIGMSANRALSIRMYKLLDAPSIKNDKKITQSIYTYVFVMFLISLLVCFFVQMMFPYLLGSNFNESIIVFNMLSVAFFINCLYFPFSNIFIFFKKTSQLSTISLITTGLNVILNIYFISKFGLNGIGLAAIISTSCLVILTLLKSKDLKTIPWSLNAAK